MTHYNISYEGLPVDEASRKAIADIKEYLGEERYEKITATAKEYVKENGPFGWTGWQLTMMLSGVRGYPLGVWYRVVHNMHPEQEIEDELDNTSADSK